MNRFTNRIVKCLVFMIGLGFLLNTSSFLFIPKNNMKESGSREVMANGILGEKENTIDVLVLGDSETYTSISPMKIWEDYGFTSYVCGTSAQQLYYSEEFLHQAFENQKPKIVFLETNAIFRKFTHYQAVENNFQSWFPVFEYHDRWKSLNLNDFGSPIKYTWTDSMKGFRYKPETLAASNRDEYMIPTDTVAEIPEINKEYVEKMAEFCRENNAQFILVSTPSTVNWNYKRHNAIQKLAEENNIEYVDLNLSVGIEQINWTTDTLDGGDHLNYLGAVKTSEYLGKYLKDKNYLTDHRDDPQFETWVKALEKYREIVKK